MPDVLPPDWRTRRAPHRHASHHEPPETVTLWSEIVSWAPAVPVAEVTMPFYCHRPEVIQWQGRCFWWSAPIGKYFEAFVYAVPNVNTAETRVTEAGE